MTRATPRYELIPALTILVSRFGLLLGALLLAEAPARPAAAQDAAGRGAPLYEECSACHSLEQGVHLTGPSLFQLWGKRVASVESFPRYSKELKAQGFIWNEATMDAWLKDPNEFVRGTYMTFNGIRNDQERANLIAFLRLALSADADTAARAQAMLAGSTVRGQVPDFLNRPTPRQLVVSVRHCRNTFFLVTADGTEHPIWETNLRLKVDTSMAGPRGEQPVLMPSGMQGDKASLIFSDPALISRIIEKRC